MLDNDLNAVGGSGLSNQALTALLQNPGDPILMYGQYFGSPDLSGPVAFSRQETVAFDWSVTPPDPSLASDDFSVRWTSTLVAPQDGSYPVGSRPGGGAALGQRRARARPLGRPDHPDQTVLTLTAGTRIAVELDYSPTEAPPSVYLGTKLQQGLWAENGGQPFLDLDPDFNTTPAFRWTGQLPGPNFDTTPANSDDAFLLWFDDILVHDPQNPDLWYSFLTYGDVPAGAFRLEGEDLNYLGFASTVAPSQFLSLAPGNGSSGLANPVLQGAYYANGSFSGAPVLLRNDVVDINWGGNSADFTTLGTASLAVEWTDPSTCRGTTPTFSYRRRAAKWPSGWTECPWPGARRIGMATLCPRPIRSS